MIVGRLGRESTLLKNGKYIKDLSYLNRDLKNVVYIDFSDENAEFHKDNVILIPRWDGSNFEDRELYDLIPFLENLGEARNVDARQEIKKLGREGTGAKFREIQLARQQYIMQQRVSQIGITIVVALEHGNRWHGREIAAAIEQWWTQGITFIQAQGIMMKRIS